MVVLFVLLVIRLFNVAIVNGDQYNKMAARQQTKKNTLSAQRGRIIDCNGLVLAQTGTSYRVLVNPQVIPESERVRIALEVADILKLDYDYVYERVCRTEKQQIVLKRQVASETVDQLEELQLGSGISFATDMKRYYPMGSLFAQLVGFSGTDGEGQTGIEASYNSYLAGKDGRFVSEVDRSGNVLPDGEEEYVEPVNGYDITITADAVAESYLEAAVKEAYNTNNASHVTALLMNPNTGEILGSTTYPTFDLNAPPRSDVTILLEMSRNRTVSEKFEAGSLFRLIVTAAALDKGVITLNDTFKCTGSEKYGLQSLYCTDPNGHGTQTVVEALRNNCDCVFMQIAEKVGVNPLYDYIYAFGFTKETGCGIPGEDTGELAHRKYIRHLELARLATGLDMTVTPVQMTCALSAMVNGGILVKPYVIQKITDENGNVIQENSPQPIQRVISEETSRQMCTVLSDCLQTNTASNAQVLNYTAGGYAGVSNVYVDKVKSETNFTATFFECIPADNPKLVLFMMIDEPEVPAVYERLIVGPWCSYAYTSLVRYYTLLPNNGQVETFEVPNVLGMPVSEAVTALGDKHLTSTTLESEQDSIVTKQVPAAGSKAIRGSRVILYTSMTGFNSEGNAHNITVKVPNFKNLRRNEALDLCEMNDLVLDFDKSACTGYVIEQSIEPETAVEPGTVITVTFNGYYAASKLNTPTPSPAPTPDPALLETEDNPDADEPEVQTVD